MLQLKKKFSVYDPNYSPKKIVDFEKIKTFADIGV